MNLNYKDWYLVEVYSRLSTAYGAERAANAVTELSEHYDALVDEGLSKGLPEIVANQSAASRLGDPQKLAQAFLLQDTIRPNFWWSIAFAIICVSNVFLESVTPKLILICAVLAIPILCGIATKRMLRPSLVFASCAIGLFFTLYTTATHVYVSNEYVPYQVAHESYLKLRAQHRNSLQIESRIASEWRSQLLDQSKHPHRIKRLVYEDLGQSQLIPKPDRSQVTFQLIPTVGTATAFVPYGALKFEVDSRLNEIHLHQAERADTLAMIRTTLNTSVMDRLKWSCISPFLQAVGFASFALLTSWFWAWITTSFRTRRTRLIA